MVNHENPENSANKNPYIGPLKSLESDKKMRRKQQVPFKWG